MKIAVFKRKSAVFYLTLFLAAGAMNFAQSAERSGISYTVEPIIGYTLEKKTNPDRTKGVLTYGGRVIAGYRILSAEAEYTEGKSTEVFSAPVMSIHEKTQRIRAGLRSTFTIASFLDWYLRGGAEMQKRHTVTTTSTTTTVSDSPSMVYPYIGTGTSIHLGDTLSLNGSITATLKDLNNLNRTEYATTFGISLAVNTK